MKSLSFRLTVWYAVIVTLTVAALLFVGRFYLERNLISGIDLLNEVEFEEIRARLEDSETNGSLLVASIKEHAELDAALYFFEINGENGEVIFKSSNLGPHALPVEVHGHPHVTVYDEELGLLRSAEFSYAGLNIHIASSLNNIKTLFKDYREASMVLCSGVFLFSLGFGHFMSRLAMRPVISIQRSARAISASNFNERISVPNTGDEIAELAQLLNAMLDRLEVSYQQVKRFTAEASHEFRTPLSIIRLQTERLLNNQSLTMAEREAALGEQMEEVVRLNKIIEDLLFLSRADSGIMSLNVKAVHLAEYLSDLADDCQLLADEHGVTFKLEGETDVTVFFDAVWIRNVLLNLFTNALAMSQAGQTVRLFVSMDNKGLYFRMLDDGPGVPENSLGLMFNRFERLSQSAGGTGLGLAICRSIVELHGGVITASNRSVHGGLCVEVSLPNANKC